MAIRPHGLFLKSQFLKTGTGVQQLRNIRSILVTAATVAAADSYTVTDAAFHNPINIRDLLDDFDVVRHAIQVNENM